MPTCILGMHRSRTSMVAQATATLGLDLGSPEHFAPSSPDNPDGYWEDLRFHRINEQILHRLNGAWDRPPEITEDTFDLSSLNDLLAEARNLIQSSAPREPWGWKDPRTCLTYAFWRRLSPDVKAVIVVRSPVEVAMSLVNRQVDNVPYERGLELWRSHYACLEPIFDQPNTLVIHSSSVISQPEVELLRLCQFISLPPDRLCEAMTKIRQRPRIGSATEIYRLEQALSTPISELYDRLCDLAGPNFDHPREMGRSDNLDAANETVDMLRELVRTKAETIERLREENRRLTHALEEARRSFENTARQIERIRKIPGVSQVLSIRRLLHR